MGVLPASAGMILDSARVSGTQVSAPRVRGDDPVYQGLDCQLLRLPALAGIIPSPYH